MTTKKLFAGLIATMFVVGLVVPTGAGAATAEELRAQIEALQDQLADLTDQLAELEGEEEVSGECPAYCADVTFDRNLSVGMTGDDVKCLQSLLNEDADTQLADSGPGSPGNETSYYGSITKAAVVTFQELYSEDILASWGLTSGTGYCGSTTRAKANELLTDLCAVEEEEEPAEEEEGEEAEEPVEAGEVSVSLSADTPTAATVVADSTNGGQALIPMLEMDFETASDESAQVNTVKVTSSGILDDSKISNAYLYEGEERIAQMTSVSSDVVTFTDSAGLFEVSGEKAVMVKMDLAKGASSGNTVAFSVDAASDIEVDGDTEITGDFPLAGNTMTVATVSDLGKLTVTNQTSGGGSVDPQDDYEVWKVSLQASNQDLSVDYLQFTDLGSTSVGDLKNFQVKIGGTQYGDTVDEESADRTVSFDLSDDPIEITSGQTKNVSLYADIKDGSTRDYQFSIQDSSDISVMDQDYGVKLFPFPSGGTVGTWTVVKATNATTISSGTLTVSRTSDAPSGNVADAATNVVLGKWSFTAAGEEIKVSTLSYQIALTDASASSTLTLKNIGLFKDGTGIGTTTSSKDDSTTASSSWTSSTSVSLGNALKIGAGETVNVTLEADLSDSSIANNDTVQVRLATGSSNGQATTSLETMNVPSSNTPGSPDALTVSSASLSSAENTSVADMTVVEGSSNVRIGSWTITAGAAEGVDVDQIVLKANDGTLNGTPSNAIGDAFTNLKLMSYDGETQYGSTKASPTTSTSGSVTFTLSDLSLPAGASGRVSVYADVKTNANSNWSDGDGLEIDSMSGTGQATYTSISDSTGGVGQGITVSTSGTLTVEVADGSPDAKILPMGTSGETVGTWKFKASNTEDLNLTQLYVYEVSNDDVPGNVDNVYLYMGGEKIAGPTPLMADTPNYAAFSVDVTIPAGSYKKISAVADITGVTNATTNKKLKFRVSTPATITGVSTDSIIAEGVNSGQYASTSSNNYEAKEHTVYGTEPTVALADGSPSGSAIPGLAEVLRFKVTNEGNSDLDLGKLTFAITSTDNSSTGWNHIANTTASEFTLYDYSDTTTALEEGNADWNIYDSSGGTTSTNAAAYAVLDLASYDLGSNDDSVTVEKGTTKTFSLYWDTTGAASGSSGDSIRLDVAAETGTLSETNNSNEFDWDDGQTATQIGGTLVNVLPTYGDTISY